MKILCVSPSYYPAFQHGGPIESVHAMNVALVNSGIKVDVITTNIALRDRKDIKLNYWNEFHGVRILYCNYLFNWKFIFSFGLFWKVLNNVSKYDLVYIPAVWDFPVLVASLACFIYKKPYIISPRGALYKDAINIKSQFIKKIYYSLIASSCINRASGIHFTTEDEYKRTIEYLKLKPKCFVVQNGLNLNKFKKLPEKGNFKKRYPILNNKRYILYFGRLNKQKGLDILIDAFSELVKIYSDLFLVIAGNDENNYKLVLEKKIADKELSQKVVFPGMMTGNEKFIAHIDADIFVLPSYFESFGMSVVESMACGLPVLISKRVGVSNEVANSNSGIVVNPSSREICLGTRKMLDNSSLRIQMVENGKKLVREKFNIDKVADMMINAYEDILKLRYS